MIGKQEGLDLLLESIAYMRRELGRNDVHFAIVGGGTEVPALRAMARDLGLEDCVQFTGRVPDELLWDILGTADVCVNPDRANEMNDKSTMNKILEYMALAKPIVQFDLTEGRYSAGDASLYAKPNDTRDFAEQLSGLLDDPERRRRMGESGRARIEGQFAWHHQVPQIARRLRSGIRRVPPSVAVIARAQLFSGPVHADPGDGEVAQDVHRPRQGVTSGNAFTHDQQQPVGARRHYQCLVGTQHRWKIAHDECMRRTTPNVGKQFIKSRGRQQFRSSLDWVADAGERQILELCTTQHFFRL